MVHKTVDPGYGQAILSSLTGKGGDTANFFAPEPRYQTQFWDLGRPIIKPAYGPGDK